MLYCRRDWCPVTIPQKLQQWDDVLFPLSSFCKCVFFFSGNVDGEVGKYVHFHVEKTWVDTGWGHQPPAEPRFTVLCSSSLRKSLTKMTHFNYNLNYMPKYDHFLPLYRNNCKFTLMLWIGDCAQQRKCPLAWTAGRPLCLKWGKCIQQLTENTFSWVYKFLQNLSWLADPD